MCASPLDPTPARPTRVKLATVVAIVSYAMVASFPGPSFPPGASVDGSWIAEINRLATVGGFGRDAAFTYGPLGFLVYPVDVRAHLAWAAILRFAVILLLAFLAALRLRRANVAVASLFALTQVSAVTLGLPFEYQLLLPLPIAAAWIIERASLAGLGALAFTAAVLAFVKTSTAAAGLVVLASVIAVWFVQRLRSRWFAVATAAGVYGGTVFAAAAWLLPSPAELIPWLRLSLAIASGYSDAMSLVGPPGEVAVAATVLAVGTLAALWLALSRRPAGVLVLAAAGPAFMAFKHAFVRQDPGHVVGFFPFVLAVLGYAILEVHDRMGRVEVWAGAALVSAVAAAWVATANYPGSRGPWLSKRRFASVLTAREGLDAIHGWADRRSLRVTHGLGTLSADRSGQVKACAGGRRVGVIPWELAVCPANELSCVPNPTLQLYSAYTSELDEASARRYEGPAAPEVVLARFEAIDGRNVALDTPLLWRTLLRGYRSTGEASSFECLERRGDVPPEGERVLGTVHAAASSWVDVPARRGHLWARVELELTAWGKAARVFFRIPPVYIQVRRESGSVFSSRLVPRTASDGIPLDDLPSSAREFADLLRGRPIADRVDAIGLLGPGLTYYEQPVRVRWIETAPVAGTSPGVLPVRSGGAVDALQRSAGRAHSPQR